MDKCEIQLQFPVHVNTAFLNEQINCHCNQFASIDTVPKLKHFRPLAGILLHNHNSIFNQSSILILTSSLQTRDNGNKVSGAKLKGKLDNSDFYMETFTSHNGI